MSVIFIILTRLLGEGKRAIPVDQLQVVAGYNNRNRGIGCFQHPSFVLSQSIVSPN